MTLTLSPTASPFPFASVVAAAYGSVPVQFDADATDVKLVTDGKEITSPDEVESALLAIAAPTNGESSKYAEFIQLAKKLADPALGYPDVLAALDSVDDHLLLRTFLVGHSISGADLALWGSIRGNTAAQGVFRRAAHIHLIRWSSYIDSLPTTQAVLNQWAEAKANKTRSKKAASSFALGLPGAVEGQVVTRFPPEPSGYLHIGHCKAAILNQYFASMYKGKMLVRFDDTNPSKEKSEFEETILEDLLMMGIKGDAISHTSDWFQELYDYAIQIIKSGNAYADDTVQEQMRAERMDGIESKRRNSTVEENLARFEEMTKGTEEGLRWCIRAKISVDNPNKAMRDPVIYRCNLTPHHRTGTKWKVYPGYDFACPIVDCIEGVTHALRTNEYRDRNPQYQWMLDALKLRKVNVWDFSRINFVYTLLSKRKLTWFVDQGLVHGWDDPRFPTVRGIMRRGMTVEALKQYMLSQGPSQATIMLEWDGIWAQNKKVIDPVAPRFWALVKEDLVKVTLKGQDAVEVKNVPKHKKNPDVGEKKTVYGPVIYVEQEDAVSFEDNEEITLMDWGNAIVTSKTKYDSGKITELTMDLHLEGDFKKTKKKVTWLAENTSEHSLASVTLLDYDYLITKKKLEEDDEVSDCVTPVSEFKTVAFADANVLELKKADIIQFERKGYYITDSVGSDIAFIKIPDGKLASLASKAKVEEKEKDASAPKPKKSAGAKGGWGKGGAPSSLKKEETEGDKVFLSEADAGFEIPVKTAMYEVKRVFGDNEVKAPSDANLYKVKPVYDV